MSAPTAQPTVQAAPTPTEAPRAAPVRNDYPGFTDDEPLPPNEPSVTAALPAGNAKQVLEHVQAAKNTKVHPDLLAADGGRLTETSVLPRDGYLPINAIAKSSPEDLLADLEAIGLADGFISEVSVSGRLPIASMRDARSIPELRFLRPERGLRSAGSVVSQGDKALRADLARAKFGVTGDGVRVGIVSDSFNCLEGMQEDIAAGELPTEVEILQDGICEIYGTDEGRAMAQIVSDVAPGATIKFHAAGLSKFTMAAAIEKLLDSGVDVIVDDIFFIGEAWLQDGVIARAVNKARAMGVAYFAAAGNSGAASYESKFRPGPDFLDTPFPSHDFDPGKGVDIGQPITIGAGLPTVIELQWSDNFKTDVPGGPAPKSDLGLVVMTPEGEPLAVSDMPNAQSLEPWEGVIVANPTNAPMKVEVFVVLVDGPPPAYFKWMMDKGKVRVDKYKTSGATTIGHLQAAGAITVGAAGFNKTPPFGQSPPLVRSYSSRGSTPIVVGPNGKVLAEGEKRFKPEIVAADGANTSFFFADTPDDDDKLPNFPGTSAAAPHAAGVAALLLERVPKAAPSDVCNALVESATEMSTKGFDYDTGHGLVAADRALTWLTKPGLTGACDIDPLKIDVPTPSVVKAKPKATPEPEPTPEVFVAPVTVTAPPVTTPRPRPASPSIAVVQERAVPGQPIELGGWHLPRNTSVSFSLDGEIPLVTAQSNRSGNLKATAKVPESVEPGRYLVVARWGSGRIHAARRLPVEAQQQIHAEASTVGEEVTPTSGSGLFQVTDILLILLMAAIIAAGIASQLRRFRQH